MADINLVCQYFSVNYLGGDSDWVVFGVEYLVGLVVVVSPYVVLHHVCPEQLYRVAASDPNRQVNQLEKQNGSLSHSMHFNFVNLLITFQK